MSTPIDARERAIAMRAEGHTYPAIAEELGVSRSTVRRWCDPSAAEDDRAQSANWKRRNRHHVAAYDQAYEHPESACRACGATGHDKRRSGLCQRCLSERTGARRRAIADMWNAGATGAEIAHLLNTTPGAIAHAIHKMRRAGWDLPYRRKLAA